MEKDYVPENKAHRKSKAGSKARKKDEHQAKKKGVSTEQQKARNPKVRLSECTLVCSMSPMYILGLRVGWSPPTWIYRIFWLILVFLNF